MGDEHVCWYMRYLSPSHQHNDGYQSQECTLGAHLDNAPSIHTIKYTEFTKKREISWEYINSTSFMKMFYQETFLLVIDMTHAAVTLKVTYNIWQTLLHPSCNLAILLNNIFTTFQVHGFLFVHGLFPSSIVFHNTADRVFFPLMLTMSLLL